MFKKITYTTTDEKKVKLRAAFNTGILWHLFIGGTGTIRFLGDVDAVTLGAFEDCETLETVTLPDTVHSIDPAAFTGCKALKDIRLTASLDFVGYEAFYDCAKILDRLSAAGRFYKGFEPGLVCRDYHFKEGVVNELKDNDKEISLCEHGFHFCDNPLSVFDYYHGADGEDMELWEVEPLGKIVRGIELEGHKYACEKIRLVRRIPLWQLCLEVEECMENTTNNTND